MSKPHGFSTPQNPLSYNPVYQDLTASGTNLYSSLFPVHMIRRCDESDFEVRRTIHTDNCGFCCMIPQSFTIWVRNL
jgi:hypothetical protein